MRRTTKYPAFERVTASRLRQGDTVLVREGKQDHWLGLGAGQYEVEMVLEGRRGIQQTPIRRLLLRDADGAVAHSAAFSPSTKLNRVSR